MSEEMEKDYANINATYGVSPEILSLSKKVKITVDEDIDNFIFTVVRPFCEMKSGYILSKNDLVEALKMYNDRKGRSFDAEPFINKPCVSSRVCEHDKQKMLDEIRAEIEKLDGMYVIRDHTFYAEKDPKHAGLWYVRVKEVLDIIDKYKEGESE